MGKKDDYQTCQELGISRDVIIQKCAEIYEIALESGTQQICWR